MASQLSIYPPAKIASTQISLAATTASSSVVIGSSDSGTIFVITADQKTTIRFGDVSSIANPTAADFPIWANSYVQFQLPTGCDRFRVFNTTGSTDLVNYWQLGRS